MALESMMKIALEGELFSQQCVNVHWVSAVGLDPHTLFDNWIANCKSLYLACMSQDYSLLTVTVTYPSGETQYQGTVDESGGQLTASSPPAVTGLITWKTAQIGRKYRGRTYMPAVPASVITDGAISVGQTAAYAAYASALRNAFSGEVDGILAVVHRFESGGLWQYQGTAIQSAIVRPYTYSQRRREIGVGK